jgi:hypothetical protein
MSFGVQVNTSVATPAAGPQTRSGTMFLAGPATPTPTTVLELSQLADFEGAVSDRSVAANAPTWDALDVFFREGGNHVYFGGYTGSTYDEGLQLLNDPRLGPGQVTVVGPALTYDAMLYSDMQSVCQNCNRVALRDVGATDMPAAMEAKGKLAPLNDDLGATFGPWVTVPGPAGVFGVGPREVPASVVIAALCNRIDIAGNPNRAAAGPYWPLQYVTSFYDATDAERAALFAAGVNAFANVYDILQNYGFQTDIPEADYAVNPFWQFNCSRARMYLKDRCQIRGQEYMFAPIDGQGHTAESLKADLDAECLALWTADGLYGDTSDDAYSVVVVEQLQNVAQGILTATADVVFSMHAKSVQIDLVTVPIGGSLT